PAGTEQPGRCRVDRHLAAALWIARHAGTGHRGKDDVARLRAADELGRAEARRARAPRHEGGLRGMTYAPRHLAAAGLFGFVIGAFVVASLGSVPGLRARAPLAAITTPAGGIDGPTNAVVETPAPTSGH